MADGMFARDLHIHTTASWCAAREMSLGAIAVAAREAGLKSVGLADHLWLDPKRGSRPSVERLLRLRTHESWSPVFLLGAEADCAPHMGIAGGHDLAKLDFVLAAYHFADLRHGRRSWPRTPGGLARVLLEGFASALASPGPCIVGHPFFIPPRIMARLGPAAGAFLADVYSKVASQAGPLFDRAAERNIGLELNAKAIGPAQGRLLQPLLRTAKERGCRFAMTSDAHRLREIGSARSLERYVSEIGIGAADLWAGPRRAAA